MIISRLNRVKKSEIILRDPIDLPLYIGYNDGVLRVQVVQPKEHSMTSNKRLSAFQLEKDRQLLIASELGMLQVGQRVAIQRHVRLFVSEFVTDAVVRVIGGTFADVEVDGKLYRYTYSRHPELYADGKTPRLQNTRLFRYVL